MSDELMRTGGRSLARRGANALIALFALSLPLSFVAMCSFAEPQIGLMLVGVPAVAAASWWALGRAARGFVAWRQRRDQRARLLKRLKEEGLDQLDSDDSRRIARERAFWKAEQLNALVALRQRFAQDPQPLDLLASVRERVMANDRTLLYTGVACALLVVGGGVIGFLITYAVEDLLGGALVGLALSLQTISCALLLLAWEGMATRRTSRKERLVFEQESRRIVTMAELAGGLTLAEHEIDEALRGALSPEVARGGELEQAGEGA
jgi:hypothetical protein